MSPLHLIIKHLISFVVSPAQLVSPSVALLAELVIPFLPPGWEGFEFAPSIDFFLPWSFLGAGTNFVCRFYCFTGF